VRDAEGLLVGRIGSEGFEGGASRDKHFPHHDRFGGWVSRLREMRRPSQMPKVAKRMAYDRAVELDGCSMTTIAVFGCIGGCDEKAADETR